MKEASKKDLYWICERMIQQIEERIADKDVDTRIGARCPLCHGYSSFTRLCNSTANCAYEAAKLAVKRRKDKPLSPKEEKEFFEMLKKNYHGPFEDARKENDVKTGN